MTGTVGSARSAAGNKNSEENRIKRTELLAPAGNYECFLAAIHAGADAVYLAGKQFGARAAADNFSRQELVSAIRYAHLFGRRVYMTVNTLLKDEELDGLCAYLSPYVEAGLDAVIVQDFGVLSVIKEEFPYLAIHCSTQMTITDEWGVRLAKELGAVRVVPARELSIDEIRRMKQTCPDMELECFVHGAMCYCYSGQCLMSSMIGGRSGNRGACAQPCRLPYEV
ncbi:MAG: U32 family peptidase, partial [Lachnospiraceae bacterium]|nr:U32 family peptidase [Lachnospiraceae bacterium]